MAGVRVTCDPAANAAYVSFTEPRVCPKAARMYPRDPVGADGMINLAFDEDGRLVGLGVLAADAKLPRYLLDAAARLDGHDA